MVNISEETPEIKKAITNLDTSKSIVHPTSFETVHKVLPYQPSVTNYEGKADSVD